MKKLFNLGFRTVLFISAFLISIGCLSQTSVGTTMSKKEVAKWYKSNGWLNGLKLKPSQSINQEGFAKQYFGNKALWDKTFEWLKTNDLASLKPGRYVIEEGNSTATVSQVQASDSVKVKWESHKNFNDLQYIIKGKANMGIATFSNANVIKPYDSKGDVANYNAKGKYSIGQPGTFFIYTPDDVHRPALKVAGGPDIITKIVIKIKAVN